MYIENWIKGDDNIYPNLLKALDDNKVNKSKLARELNINRRALYNKLSGKVRFYKDEFDYIYNNYLKDYDYWILSKRVDD